MLKNWLARLVALCLIGFLTVQDTFAVLTTASFDDAIDTTTVLAQTLNVIFFAIVPIALVIGLSIWGYRMVRRLAR